MTFTVDRRRGPALVTVGVLAFATLAGCSQKPRQAGVPTLAATAAASGVASASPAAAQRSDQGRPRLRMDMTREERDRLYDAHTQCLYDHGWPKDINQRPSVGRARYQQMYEACQSLQPLGVWEYDANNPEARSNVHKVVDCLRKHGVKYVDEAEPGSGDDQVGFGFGGKNNDPESIRKGMELTPVCEKQLFGGVSH